MEKQRGKLARLTVFGPKPQQPVIDKLWQAKLADPSWSADGKDGKVSGSLESAAAPDTQGPPTLDTPHVSRGAEREYKAHHGIGREPVAGSDRPSRIMSADGIRAFAALMVFVSHFRWLFSPYLDPESFSFKLATFIWGTITRAGVPLFFALSGYLIYGGLVRKSMGLVDTGRATGRVGGFLVDYGAFMWRRVRRLYPTFACMVAVYVILSYLFPAESKLPKEITATVMYVGQNLAFLAGILDIPPIITVSWTLSFQFFFYLSIPVLVASLGMRHWQGWQRTAFFVWLWLCFLGCVLAGFYGRIFAGFMEFICGILLYEAQRSNWVKRRLHRAGEIAASAAFLGSLVLVYLLRYHGEMLSAQVVSEPGQKLIAASLTFLGLFWFLLYCFASNGFLTKFFSWRPLRLVGLISYSFFLMHGLALNGMLFLMNRLLPPGGHHPVLFWSLLPASLLVALASSSVLFLLVEKPFSMRSGSAAAA